MVMRGNEIVKTSDRFLHIPLRIVFILHTFLASSATEATEAYDYENSDGATEAIF